MELSLPIALSWSLAGVWGASVAPDGMAAAGNAGLLAMAVAVAARSFRPMVTAFLWSAPFFALLLLVHGVVGPLFPVDGHVLGLPWRSAGAAYACRLGSFIVSASMVFFLWSCVARKAIINGLISTGLPAPLIMTAGQTMAIIVLLRRRAETVFIAQRARGIPVDGNFMQRAIALPSVVLPVVVSSLVEADVRSLMLVSRGFFDGRPINLTRRKASRREVIVAMTLPLIIVVFQCAR